MRRRYLTADFRRIVNLVRERVPEAAITTDVIVGFPGETPELFEETHQFLAEMQLAKLHVFKYSPREGTRLLIFQIKWRDQKKTAAAMY